MASIVADCSPHSNIEIEWIPEYSMYPAFHSGDIKALCSLKAPRFEPEKSDPRGRLDLMAVIDISTSMIGNLSQVKNLLEIIINELGKDDRFGLVTFHNIAEVKFPLTYMEPENKKEKIKIIHKLRVQGETNLCEGLLTGMYEIIDRPATVEKAGDIASVLLFTDGQANKEITDKKRIINEMKKAINPPKQFIPFKGTVNTFGFGSSHDHSLLKAISEEGILGTYHYIPDEKQLEKTMMVCFGGLISTLSKDIILKFTSVDDNVILKVHTAQEPEWKVKGKRCVAKIGDLQSEETRDILVEINIPHPSIEADPVVICELEYLNVITNLKTTTKSTLKLAKSSMFTEVGTANNEVDTHKNRLVVTQAMKKAQQLAEKEEISEARQILLDAKDQISKSVSRNEKLSLKLSSDLDEVIRTMETSSVYKSHGAHYLVSREQSHSMQRMTAFNSGGDLYSSYSKEHYVNVLKTK